MSLSRLVNPRSSATSTSICLRPINTCPITTRAITGRNDRSNWGNQLITRTRANHNVTSIVVTHNMTTVRKVADRVVMLYPLSRIAEGESQILYDGAPDKILSSPDDRVSQFVCGEAGARLLEMQELDSNRNQHESYS